MSARSSTKKRSKSSSSSSAANVAKLSEPLQECHAILKFFQQRPDADPFLEPVDWEAFGLNDYPEIITHPMDLGTVQNKLEDGKYTAPNDFAKDMRLTFKNAMTYNRPDSEIFETAEKLFKLFEKKFSKIKSGSKKARKDDDGGKSAEEREATRNDRLKFSAMVSQLNSEQLGQLVTIIQKECHDAINDDDEEELEIEINTLDLNTLQQLIAFCIQCVEAKGDKGETPKPKKK